MSTARPAQLQVLDPYVAQWGLPTLQQRREKRLRSTLEELREFHDAMLPHLEAVIEFLNQFPPDRIPDEHRALGYAALAMCEVDDPVNKWRSVTLTEALDPRHFRIKRNFFDTAPPQGFPGEQP